jgi:outer membrane protein OmpA-like peptidoglycan-associated protein
MCRAVIPQLIKRGGGHVLNVSSMAGAIGIYGYTAYAASKFAICGFSEALRGEMWPHKISVSREGIDLREKVYFDTANDVILGRSFALLDQVAAVMNAYPEITLLSVEGHTDNRGDDASNLGLSLRRAQSVVSYLVRKGVAGNRLVAKGYGETRPLDASDTEAAWEANRRVDVLIESWATPQ